jgi:hypothetical protein
LLLNADQKLKPWNQRKQQWRELCFLLTYVQRTSSDLAKLSVTILPLIEVHAARVGVPVSYTSSVCMP